MSVSLEQLQLILQLQHQQMLAFQQQQNQQMLALQQQLFETVLGRLFIQPENKESIYVADNGAAMDNSEAYPVEDSHPFIPESEHMGSYNNSQNFDEISYKNEENMSAVSNDGQKSNLILLDVDFLNDSLSTNEIHNEFENNGLKSKVVHYRLVIFSGFSIQYEKHGLNKVLLIVIRRHKDPTLFRGGGECWRI
ncbi:unnamed protein product [Schistosoma mattheei]|uniref:Uncharacterized protein n=1 Tax=Schistosoma mattheei TaxID=31246 RepID=A0A183NQV6_9TREM|nr:unnamed protein product [Schistosoma mattheei]